MEGMSAISGSIEEERGTNGRSKKDRKGKKGTRWGKEINRRCKRGFAKRERVTNPFSFRNSIKQYNVPDILSTLPSSFSFYYRMVSSISRSSTVLLWVKAEILENAWERTSLLRLDIDWKITYFLTYFHTLCAHMRRPTHKKMWGLISELVAVWPTPKNGFPGDEFFACRHGQKSLTQCQISPLSLSTSVGLL